MCTELRKTAINFLVFFPPSSHVVSPNILQPNYQWSLTYKLETRDRQQIYGLNITHGTTLGTVWLTANFFNGFPFLCADTVVPIIVYSSYANNTGTFCFVHKLLACKNCALFWPNNFNLGSKIQGSCGNEMYRSVHRHTFSHSFPKEFFFRISFNYSFIAGFLIHHANVTVPHLWNGIGEFALEIDATLLRDSIFLVFLFFFGFFVVFFLTCGKLLLCGLETL